MLRIVASNARINRSGYEKRSSDRSGLSAGVPTKGEVLVMHRKAAAHAIREIVLERLGDHGEGELIPGNIVFRK